MDGTFCIPHLAYYEQRAKGGVGLYLENARIDYPMGTNGAGSADGQRPVYLWLVEL